MREHPTHAVQDDAEARGGFLPREGSRCGSCGPAVTDRLASLLPQAHGPLPKPLEKDIRQLFVRVPTESLRQHCWGRQAAQLLRCHPGHSPKPKRLHSQLCFQPSFRSAAKDGSGPADSHRSPHAELLKDQGQAAVAREQ